MWILYTTVLALVAGAFGQPAAAQSLGTEADRLYSNRDRLADAYRAADLWQQAMTHNPKDIDAGAKLARACYWLGGHASEPDEVRKQFDRGMTAARAVIAAAPNRPEGHFWLAANMAGLAETQGMRAGLRYRTPIREELERVLAIDPAFLQGSADRALGRWYYKVPGLFGGSKKDSEAHLRKALTYNPQSTATLYFLAETLIAEGKRDEARTILQRVMNAPLDPDWAPEDREFKRKAGALLRQDK